MNMKTFNEMPEDLQEVLVCAARVKNLDITAMTIPTDASGRQKLAEGGMETIKIPDDELITAADWCWKKFLSKRGTMEHINKMIDIYTAARKLYKAYYGPKQLPV